MSRRPPDRSAFVRRYGGVYEHSPWVAEAAWDLLDDPGTGDIEELHAAMRKAMRAAGEDRQFDLIRAHPDLAGKAARAGQLTAASSGEQSSAGLDAMSDDQFERFQRLNSAYRQRFGFPFIIAVRGLDREQVLASFEQRLHNDPAREFETALAQIDRIAMLRLQQMQGDP